MKKVILIFSIFICSLVAKAQHESAVTYHAKDSIGIFNVWLNLNHWSQLRNIEDAVNDIMDDTLLLFVRKSDSTILFVTPKQLAESIASFITKQDTIKHAENTDSLQGNDTASLKPVINYWNLLGNDLSYSPGNIKIDADNNKLFFGADNDASITYNGGNLMINPKEIGSGAVIFQGGINGAQYIYADYIGTTTNNGIVTYMAQVFITCACLQLLVACLADKLKQFKTQKKKSDTGR